MRKKTNKSLSNTNIMVINRIAYSLDFISHNAALDAAARRKTGGCQESLKFLSVSTPLLLVLFLSEFGKKLRKMCYSFFLISRSV